MLSFDEGHSLHVAFDCTLYSVYIFCIYRQAGVKPQFSEGAIATCKSKISVIQFYSTLMNAIFVMKQET